MRLWHRYFLANFFRNFSAHTTLSKTSLLDRYFPVNFFKNIYFAEKRCFKKVKTPYIPLNFQLYLWKYYKNENKNFIFMITEVEVSVIKR